MHSDGSCPTGDKSHCAALGSGDVHHGVPGTAPLAEPGRYEEDRQIVKSSHLYLYSAFNNTDCVKALNSIKLEDRVSVMYNNKIKHSIFS